MQKLELFDETFDPDRTDSYELSIQFSLNGFSFCVKDLVRNCFIALVSNSIIEDEQADDWSKPISSISKTHVWLSKPFKKVIFSFESHIFTLVPKGFFEPSKSKKLLELVLPLPDLYEVRFNTFNDMLTCIYALPSGLVGEWLKIQPKTHFIGFCEPVIAYHMVNAQNPKNNSITISYADKFATVTISKGLQLQHCTTIEIHTHEDTAYHLVNMCRSIGLETKDVSVVAIGNLIEADKLGTIIRRFFLNFTNTSNFDQNHFSYLLSKHQGKFANLFNQTLCEL